MKRFLHKLSLVLAVSCVLAISGDAQQTSSPASSSPTASISSGETTKKNALPLRYGLLIDNSGSMRAELNNVLRVGRAVVANSKQADEGFFISFTSSDNINLHQDMTAAKRLLSDAIDNLFIDKGQTALYDALYVAAGHLIEKTPSNADGVQRVLILITDGENRSSKTKDKELRVYLTENKIKVFALGLIYNVDGKHGTNRKQVAHNLTTLATETGGGAFIIEKPDEFQIRAAALIVALRGL